MKAKVILCRKCKSIIVIRKEYPNQTIDQLQYATLKQVVSLFDYTIGVTVSCKKCNTDNELIKEEV
jgi:hypothetical protein